MEWKQKLALFFFVQEDEEQVSTPKIVPPPYLLRYSVIIAIGIAAIWWASLGARPIWRIVFAYGATIKPYYVLISFAYVIVGMLVISLHKKLPTDMDAPSWYEWLDSYFLVSAFGIIAGTLWNFYYTIRNILYVWQEIPLLQAILVADGMLVYTIMHYLFALFFSMSILKKYFIRQ